MKFYTKETAKFSIVFFILILAIECCGWTWPLSKSETPDTFTSAFGPRDKSSSGFTYNFHKGMDLQ
ncbi:MAG: hypothetical protein KAS49_00385 [Candidatus Cloacimonetes bacterium]|nr:hypothetical protein [Candidatus Cloacimonadota bacterium]